MTTVNGLARERACASGTSALGEGRILAPQIVSGADAILVTILVRQRPGAQECQGNPDFPLAIVLPEALGERDLLDGSEIPPRDATVVPD